MLKNKNEVIKILDTENNRNWILVLIFLFFASFLGGLFSQGNRECVLWYRLLRYYFTKKLFSATNFKKMHDMKFRTDVSELLQNISKLYSKQKNAIIDYLNESIPEFKVKKIGDLITAKKHRDLKRALKKLSYKSRKTFDQCNADISCLLKIYRIVCEYIVLSIQKDGYQPSNDIVTDYIDIIELIENPDEKMSVLKNKLINYTESNDGNISNDIMELWKCNHFSEFVNSYIEAKSTKTYNLPIPKEFDADRLRNLYDKMSKEGYFEGGQVDGFAAIFCDGIEDGQHIIWKNKNQYEFNFFINELYCSTFQKLDAAIKENVPKIFAYKGGKTSLKLNNENNEDNNDDRKPKREKIKMLVNDCRKKV